MDVNMLGKFYNMTRVNRLLYGVEICTVVGDENSRPDTGQILQGSVKNSLTYGYRDAENGLGKDTSR
jgi:hypothetical protein